MQNGKMGSIAVETVQEKTKNKLWKTIERLIDKTALVFYDLIAILTVCLFVNAQNAFILHIFRWRDCIFQTALCAVSLLFFRIIWKVYLQIWRYADISAYIHLFLADLCGGAVYYLLNRLGKFIGFQPVSFVTAMVTVESCFAVCIMMRFCYHYFCRFGFPQNIVGRILHRIADFLMSPKEYSIQRETEQEKEKNSRKIGVAIIGAGRVGTALAHELRDNPRSIYEAKFFIENDEMKIGRKVMNLEVIGEDRITEELLTQYRVQEVIFAVTSMDTEKRNELYRFYKGLGVKVETYDYPLAESGQPEPNTKRQLREISVEELLFRKPRDFLTDEVKAYYCGKKILISGGGGSIGSELCRQLARMEPSQLTILDVYENNAYDIQQELKNNYPSLDVQVRIATVCDAKRLDSIFAELRPEIVLHAAAHKHVPLMEKDCCEAVKNNVFGTFNMANTAEKYGVRRFIMISTDKAVNPTNVMGATKRMCEMLILSRSRKNYLCDTESANGTTFSATRFGNVLGSNGSVIPLFRRQLERGGPLTITDKRIIRYFMTIPEAAQLVLHSGVMAKNGELYVLDMGEQVKVLELAENMIRLNGLEPYKDIDIIEIGLRPGEKLYEELLIHRETMRKTENKMIFIEQDPPLGAEEIEKKLEILRNAVESNEDSVVKAALKQTVPTFRDPKEVNAEALARA